MPAKEITETVEQSLKRMQVDYVDLLLKAVAGPQYLDKVVNEQLPVIIKLKEQGKIRFLGSSEQTRSDGGHQWLQKILPLDLLDVVMVGHNFINQSTQRSLFPICQQQNVGVINVFTVRRAFADKNRLKEVVGNLQHRNVVVLEKHLKSLIINELS